MIFTCPACERAINVNRLPVRCCGSRHDESSLAIREGSLPTPDRPARKTVSYNTGPCIYRSAASRREWCGPCKGYLKVYRCDHFDSECVIGKTIKGIRTCDNCKAKRSPGDSTHIVIDASRHGAGDAMLSAWIAEGSNAAGRKVFHYVRPEQSDLSELLTIFRQSIITVEYRDAIRNCDPRDIEMHSRGRKSRLSVRAGVVRADGTPTRPTPIPPDERTSEWLESVRTDNTILLYPQSADASREWPIRHWRRLRKMLADGGYAVRIIMPKAVDSVESWSLTWPQNIALMQTAKLVIGNDSGPVHVAGTLDVPTLAVCGPTGQRGVFDHMPSVRTVAASQEVISCVGCCYGVEFEESCKRECRALGLTTPEQVYQVAKDML